MVELAAVVTLAAVNVVLAPKVIAPVNASITFYKTLDDFFAESNALGESYINDKPYLEMILHLVLHYIL